MERDKIWEVRDGRYALQAQLGATAHSDDRDPREANNRGKELRHLRSGLFRKNR